MIAAANRPIQRPADAKLLAVDRNGCVVDGPRTALADILRPGDLVIANDAATLPASLQGVHLNSGRAIEARLAGRQSLARDDVHEFAAIVFGEGDFHTRTEDRAAPPPLAPGDRVVFGPLAATVLTTLGHPRLVRLRFEGSSDAHLGRLVAARTPDPVRACSRAAGAMGRLDRDCRAAGRVRIALGGIRAGLADAERDACQRDRVRDGDARRRHFIDRRRRAGRPPAVRRAIRHSGRDRVGDCTRARSRGPHRGGGHDRRSGARTRRGRRWIRPRGRRPGQSAHRAFHSVAGGGRDPLRCARARDQPLSAAAGVHRRRHARSHGRCHDRARISRA